MKASLASLVVMSLLFASVSCSSGERDGRKYYGATSPVQGKMGVQFKRVKADTPPPSAETAAAPAAGEASAPASKPKDDGTLLGALGVGGGSEAEPPGLLDRNAKPDEPGAQYWMHGQQSVSPVQSKMGVRVSRRKK